MVATLRKSLKYALMVAALILACATIALAADGDPVVATVNGQPFSSLSEAVSNASIGDRIFLVSDTTVEQTLNIYGNLQIPSGVRLTSTSPINLYGLQNTFSGDVICNSSSSSNFISIYNGVTNIYGNIYSSPGSRAVTIREDAPDSVRVNVFGGSFTGNLFALRNNKAADNLLILGGTFQPSVSGPYRLNGASVVSESPLIVSWGGMYELGQIVSESISWIGLFCAAIVANKLLLVFLIFVLGFVAIGLIKRLINN